MKTIFLFYVVAQLISTAYGVAVIESIRPFVKAKLYDEGYVLKNKNSLYKYSNDIVNFFKGFIPFYYTILAVNLINSKDPVKKAMHDEIKNGNYISKEEQEFLDKQEEENKLNSNASVSEEIVFEKPEKYTARKSDNTLYDTYITPIEYIVKENSKDNELNITPFMDKDKIIEHVVVKEEVSKSDIAKAISELNYEEIDSLIPVLMELSELKKNNKKLSLKDAA